MKLMLKTNLLRINFRQEHFKYEVNISAKCPIEEMFMVEVSLYVGENLPKVLYQHPWLYSAEKLEGLEYFGHFSNGRAYQLQLQLLKSQEEGSVLCGLIAEKMLALIKMVPCSQLKAHFNPFQQNQFDELKTMPGWQLSGQTTTQPQTTFLCFNAVELHIHPASSLSQSLSDVLIDHDSGLFYQREAIVRVDNGQGLVHFRNGQKSRRQALCPVTLHHLNGYALAHLINELLVRIKQNCKTFSQVWKIQLDKRFYDVPAELPTAGTLGFRQGVDKAMSSLVSAMSQVNYTYNYVHLFNEVSYEDILTGSLIIFCSQQSQEQVSRFRDGIDKVIKRMSLKSSCRIVPFKDLNHLQELVTLVHGQGMGMGQSLFLIFYNYQSKEKELYQKTVQGFINNIMPFHLIQQNSLNKLDQEQHQELVYRHMSIIYTKFRLNPWKVKNLPFMSQPMMLITLNIKTNKDKLLSVAVVATMNVFFTKFTASYRGNISSKQGLSQVVAELVVGCANTFQSKHQRYPQRLFLVQTEAQEQLNVDSCREQLAKIGIHMTYITLNNAHQIRMYVQHDSNYVARDSVKKVQLTSHVNINKEIYYQLELQRPPYRIGISPLEKSDPNFVPKILELLGKVSEAAGHQYGKGLGILDYSSKLNGFRDYNLSKWQYSLREGILMFL